MNEFNHPLYAGPYRFVGSFPTGCLVDSWKAVKKDSEGFYVVRSYPKSVFDDLNSRQSISNECYLRQKLRHQYISSFVEVIQEGDYSHLVTKGPSGISLTEYLLKNGPLDYEKTMLSIARIIWVFQYLIDDFEIFNCELNSDNIFMDFQGEIELVFFSFEEQKMTPNSISNMCYKPPEFFSATKTGLSAYSWTIGVLAYQMCMGKLPFTGRNDDEIEYKILKTHPEDFAEINQVLRNLILKCLIKNPLMRMTFGDIKSNDMFILLEPSLNERKARRLSEFDEKTCSIAGSNSYSGNTPIKTRPRGNTVSEKNKVYDIAPSVRITSKKLYGRPRYPAGSPPPNNIK